MKLKQLIFPVLMGIGVFGCNEDEPEEMKSVVEITTADFTATIEEDPSEGQILGKVEGSASEGSVKFSLSSQEPEDAMTIDSSSGELKVKEVAAFDFETRNEVTGIVKVTSGEVSKESKITITITDVPVVVTTEDFSASIDENPASELSLGMVSGTASEGSVTYALIKQDVEDALTIDSSTGELTVKTPSVFDYEKRESYGATVTVTGGSDVKESKVVITINNVTEITASDFAAEIDEDPENGQSIGTVKGSTDTGSLAFSISTQDPADALAIDTSTGVLTVKDQSLFDYQERASISAIVTLESGGVSTEINVTITIQEVVGSWLAVGEAMFSGTVNSYLDMTFDSNGTPYVAYQNGQFQGRKATVMKYNGSSWSHVGTAGFSDDWASFVSIAINENTPFNTPYVAFTDVAQNNKVTVMKFNEGAWANVGSAGFSPINAEYTKLAINNGTPYVAFADGANSDKATVMKYVGNTNTWVNVGTPGFSTSDARYFSLVFDNDVPYLAFRDAGNSNKITVMKFDGTNWVAVGSPGFSVSGIISLELVFNEGTPYVAFSGGTFTKASLMKFDGSEWKLVGDGDFSGRNCEYVSVAFDKDIPYVAFKDGTNNSKATVMKYQHSKWTMVASAGISTGAVRYVRMKVNDGTPYVGFMESGCCGYEATVLKYIKYIER